QVIEGDLVAPDRLVLEADHVRYAVGGIHGLVADGEGRLHTIWHTRVTPAERGGKVRTAQWRVRLGLPGSCALANARADLRASRALECAQSAENVDRGPCAVAAGGSVDPLRSRSREARAFRLCANCAERGVRNAGRSRHACRAWLACYVAEV